MALIRGQEVKEGPKQVPANPRLYNMITTQAKTRFAKYPSPAAAHWVHAKYVQMGGKFVDSKKEVDPRFRDYAKEAQDKKEKDQKKKVTKKVGKGNVAGEAFRK
jgi:hypothetical protein